MKAGLSFVGEQGFYPTWASPSRWVFQRTLISVGGMMAGYAEIEPSQVSVAGQIIVWIPPRGGFLRGLMPSALHSERNEALHQLAAFILRCYGKDCPLTIAYVQQAQSVVADASLRPAQWRLQCPTCVGKVGPSLEVVNAKTIIQRWEAVGRPCLENPGASAVFSAAAPIKDLPAWVGKNDPSHLELAYLGQQLWADLHTMMAALSSAV